MSRYTLWPYYVCIFTMGQLLGETPEYGLQVYLETSNFSQVHSRSPKRIIKVDSSGCGQRVYLELVYLGP